MRSTLLLSVLFWCHIYALDDVFIDERKIDIYFANGIDTERFEAKNNSDLLDVTILRELPEIYEKYLGEVGENGKVGYTYNQTNGKTLDFTESILVKFGLQGFMDFFFPTDHEENLYDQIETYKDSIKLGHKVLVVAHSQGNLFTGEAYNALDDWMKPYFEAISVASPRAFKIKSNTPHVAWNTDPVPWFGVVFDGIDNPNNEVGGVASHSFTYYMGSPDPDTGLSTDVAKNLILEYSATGLLTLAGQNSQWKIKQTIGCGCDKKVLLTHIESTAKLDHLVEGVNPLTFEETGKLYQVYDETNITLHWVKGDFNGTAVKNEQDHLPNVCYSLTGTEELIKGSNNPDPHDGLLRVVLDWDKKDIDLNLGVNGPTAGVKEEHPEYECPRENWYIETKSGLSKGDYFVSITAPSNVDEALMPEKIRIDVKAMGKGEYIGIDINDSALLSLGEVYKIHVELPENGRTPSSTIEVVTPQPTTRPIRYHEDDDGTIYTADIFLLVKQLALGPIAGASLRLEKLYNGVWQELYTGVTTSGTTINSNGLIVFPSTLQESVVDNDLLLLTASGGQDVDVDDDLNMDVTPTTVLGKLHAFMASENVVGNNFKVNILTEIAYQAVHNRIDENTTQEALLTMLDGVAKLLLKKDLNEDSVISYSDTTSWLASFDKETLQFDYDAKIEPIVQKIYSGEDIYLDVYKLLYAGKIDAIQIDDNVTANALRLDLNSYADLSQLQKEDFVLKDSSGSSVDFTFAIVNGKVVIDPLNDFVDGQSYTLFFDLKIYDSQDNVYVDTQLHEFIVPDTTPPVIPESTIHINENYAGYLPFNAADPSTPLTYTIVGGVDSVLLEIKNVFVGYGKYADRIYFKETPNYERPADSNGDNIYELDIGVADRFGNKTSQSIIIIIDDVKEGPLLADTNLSVNEDVPIGTYVGNMTVLNEGDGNLTGFYISTYNEMNFKIDREGKIFTTTIFDFERFSEYIIRVAAYNDVGATSAQKNVYIKVNDIYEPVPEVHSYTGSMDEYALAGKIVGQLYVYPGLGEVTDISLVGQGSDDFDVNSSGHITVSSGANLDPSIQKQYDLKAMATNTYGESDEANVTIYINVWTKQVGTKLRDYSSVIAVDNENSFYFTGEINIDYPRKGTTFISKYNSTGELMWSYENNQSEKIRFGSIVVDKNGTVFVTGAKATGRTYGKYNYEIYAAWIMALNYQGEVLWTKTLDNGATGYDSFMSAFIDTDGNIVASGRTYGFFPGYENNGGSDLFFAKFTTVGEIDWIKQFDISSSIVQVNSKGEHYILSSNTMIKFGISLNNIIWSRELVIPNISKYDYVDFALDSNNNIYMLCDEPIWEYWEEDEIEYIIDNRNSVVVKLNEDAELVWKKSYGSDKYEFPYAITTNENNEIYFIGDTRGDLYNNINKVPYIDSEDVGDVFLTKIDTDGNMMETKQFGSTGWDGSGKITIDANNDIYMTGGVSKSLDGNTHFGGYDMFIMKVPY